jgi:hypothetical protein
MKKWLYANHIIGFTFSCFLSVKHSCQQRVNFNKVGVLSIRLTEYQAIHEVPFLLPTQMAWTIKGLPTGHKFTGEVDRALSHPSGSIHACGLPHPNDMDFKGLPTRHKLNSLERLTEY